MVGDGERSSVMRCDERAGCCLGGEREREREREGERERERMIERGREQREGCGCNVCAAL